ncbi:hypothetical protein BDV25DRAFT_126442 [Aspergillus avenaceus]|uniref:Rhodopsin domain-containing protein n=1 Tax=Aspergillus avenaceus TaxID=36643 RepID=A0A5N6U7L4_ASPAV|nr:hypothetical protein BDV25DRAFT_126442 [Aspergillus avenaceus]
MNPQTHVVTITSTLFTAIAFIAVCLRLFARGFIIRALGLDDSSYCMIGFAVIQTIAFILSSALHCPPWKWANYPVYLLSCSKDIEIFFFASGALNILTDVLTYVMPIPVILNLQMPSKQKTYIIIILGLGMIACISSVVRLVYGAKLMSFPPDAVAIAGTFNWTSIEMNLGILAASIPSFKAIASRLVPRLIGECPSSELQTPLTNLNDVERGTNAFHRRRHSFGMSVLYSRNSAIASPVHPAQSQERFHIPENVIATQVEFDVTYKRRDSDSDRSW